MNVGELRRKLSTFDAGLQVRVIAHCKAYDNFSICHQAPDGGPLETFDFYVDELCSSESAQPQDGEQSENVTQHTQAGSAQICRCPSGYLGTKLRPASADGRCIRCGLPGKLQLG